MEAPRPPSPPSGPPRGTCASRRIVEALSPPAPARTVMRTSSRNIGPIVAWAPDRPAARHRRRGGALQVPHRVDRVAAVPRVADPDLEVEVRTRRVARLADPPHALRPGDVLPRPDRQRRHVVVRRVEPAAVRDPDLVTAAVGLPARKDDAPGAGRDHGRPVIRGDVDRPVARVEVLADVVVATDDRPVESAP